MTSAPAKRWHVTRKGDVFVDGKYAGRVIKTGRRWGAERWIRSARPLHVALGDSYRTRGDAAAAVGEARLAETGDL